GGRNGAVLWFEGAAERLEADENRGLRVLHGGQELVFLKHQTRDLVRLMCEQSPTTSDDILSQIRKQTSSIGGLDLMRFPQVHKLMSWSDLRALRDTGQVRFAAHSL